MGDNISTCGGITSVLWGDNISTVESIQYRLLLDTENLKARIISFKNLESQYTCTKSGSSYYGPTNYGKTGKVIL